MTIFDLKNKFQQSKLETCGFKVLNQSLTNGRNNIQLKELNKGMYIYRIQSENGDILKTDKLIIE